MSYPNANDVELYDAEEPVLPLGFNIVELVVEATKSMNYQTYKVGYRVSIQNKSEEQVEEIRKVLQAKARRAVMEQINIDRGKK